MNNNKRKILFVTTRSPFSNIFSGDRQRARTIIQHLNKKNNLDVVYSDYFAGKHDPEVKKFFFKNNIIDKIKGILKCCITFEPLQLGYFYSKNVNNFVNQNHEKYHTIIFHLIRSAQYLPKDFHGKRILEMTDLMSKNYNQVVKSLSIFNPLTYIYFLEKYLVKKYEDHCENYFDKIVLASKNDLKNTKNNDSKKFVEVPNTVNANKNIFKYKNSNYKILFIGNLNYLPNKEACKNFTRNTLPILNKKYPNIEFHIIGEIKTIDRIYFKSIKNTYVHGSLKKIEFIIKNSICGICNIKIATGTQMKMLTYMSYGLPCISSKTALQNTFFKKGKEVLVYENNEEFVKIIEKLKNDKKLSNNISKSSYSAFKKKYSKNKILSIYDKII